MSKKSELLGILCGVCRQDFHCGKCACCMPEEELAERVKRIKGASVKSTDPTPLPVTEKKETCPQCGSDNVRERLPVDKNIIFDYICRDRWHDEPLPTGEPSAALDVEQLAREWVHNKAWVGNYAPDWNAAQFAAFYNYVLAKQKEAEGRK